MTEEEVRALIEEACAQLYRGERQLIDYRANERTIAGRLAGYLAPRFDGWDVDADYNRAGDAGAIKRDERGPIVPDIIIHRRGQMHGANLVVIEMKGYWNREDRAVDEMQLRRMAAEYGYQFLFRLELGRDAARLKAVQRAEERVPVGL